MPTTWSEIRNTARGLLRSPTVTLCAVICLALGIGVVLAAMAAAIIPALRAARVDPVVAIQVE